MNIPSRFQLFGRWIEVDFVDDLVDGRNIVGSSNYDKQHIHLQRPSASHKRSDAEIEQTFLHELTHLLLRGAGRPDLCHDEDFVAVFSSLLHQALTSVEYDDDEDDYDDDAPIEFEMDDEAFVDYKEER